jgi:hypothetical protein
MLGRVLGKSIRQNQKIASSVLGIYRGSVSLLHYGGMFMSRIRQRFLVLGSNP